MSESWFNFFAKLNNSAFKFAVGALFGIIFGWLLLQTSKSCSQDNAITKIETIAEKNADQNDKDHKTVFQILDKINVSIQDVRDKVIRIDENIKLKSDISKKATPSTPDNAVGRRFIQDVSGQGY